MTQPAVFDLLLCPPAQVARLDVRLPGLRTVLDRLGWSQTRFAQEAGIARITINRIAQGHACALETALSILAALEARERAMTSTERGKLTGQAWKKSVDRTTLVKLLLDQPVAPADPLSTSADPEPA